jgi:hypothetical protein
MAWGSMVKTFSFNFGSYNKLARVVPWIEYPTVVYEILSIEYILNLLLTESLKSSGGEEEEGVLVQKTSLDGSLFVHRRDDCLAAIRANLCRDWSGQLQ